MPTATSQRTVYIVQSSGGDPYRLELNTKVRSPLGHLMYARVSVPKVLGAFAWFFLLYVVLEHDASLQEPQLRSSVFFSEFLPSDNAQVIPPLEPVGLVIADTEVFYMMPTSVDVLGILIFFHDCNHSAQDLFRLPEDRIIATTSLRRGLAVLAISSEDSETGCWSEEDYILLKRKKVVEKWIRMVGISPSIPRIGMGVSSGGAFLFRVHKLLGLKSIASYIVSDGFPKDELVKDANGRASLPATAFVHMPRDKRTARNVTKNASALRSLGVPNKLFEVKPHPFTPELCDRRLPEVGDRRCHNFLNRIHSKFPGLLDKHNNVIQSVWEGDWKEAFEDSKFDDELRHFVGGPPAQRGQLNPLHTSGHSWSWAAMWEEIAVSYAEHEMTSEHRNQVLDFLMSNAGIQFESEKDKRKGLLGVVL